jgi:hypothetical protein
MNNTKWVVNALERKLTFKDYAMNCSEEENGVITEYYDVTKQGQAYELKVSYEENAGHWVDFEIETREAGCEDWNYLDTLEVYIA